MCRSFEKFLLSNTMLRFILSIIICLRIIGVTTSVIIFPHITTIETKHPIVNETMYAAYPNLWLLDMSNQTRFEFPVDQVLLIHDCLTHYVCNNCGIHSIYQISLSQLPELTSLIVNNNTLQYIHPDAFEYNTLLKKVSLVGNQLSTFNPEATIRHMPALNILYLSSNEQFDLNKVDLQSPRLMQLFCNYCHTTFLVQQTLTNMPRLSVLYLSYNVIDRIDDDALMLAKYIKRLTINGNKPLHRLNLTSTSLIDLNAAECSLNGTLDTSHLPMLESINVRNNRIARINEDGFQQNPDIKIILLDDNSIEKVPTILLGLPMNRLEQLCMDRNPLQPCNQTDYAKELYEIRRLRRSCLDDKNPLHEFENYLPITTGKAVYKKTPIHLRSSDGLTVDLSGREIVYIEPDYLVDDRNVTNVLFDDNRSFEFQQDTIFLKSSSVELISLQNCSITTLYEATFKELPNLKTLHLQGNQVRSIHSHLLFKNNPTLTFLSLSHNNLELIVANAFQNHSQLEVLHLDWNGHLSNSAHGPFLLSASLRKLSCRHCRFVRLDNMALTGLPNLIELNLEHNHIELLEADALRWTTELKYLNLRHNRLVVFKPNVYQLNHMKTLCLAGNPQFDFEQLLLHDIQKIKQLNKDCQDEQFSNNLVERYKLIKEVKNGTMELGQSKPVSLMYVETSSTVSLTADVSIILLMACSLVTYQVLFLSHNLFCHLFLNFNNTHGL
ncbi:protein artichoke-like isoform X2 [Ochlerotatus camptorhynchus]|uniref:protein artichoke-like isoform X2 n=1 Tax=Ochlerotatus camptorhynchus TaxID=644619 RepID=UPI0031CEEE24